MNATKAFLKYLVIAMMGIDGAHTPSAYPYADNNYAQESDGDGGDGSVAACSDELNGSSFDPGTFTITSDQWVAGTITVEPSGGGGLSIPVAMHHYMRLFGSR